MTKQEIEYILETTKDLSGLSGEITIVGGAALMLLFNQNTRSTEDVDVLTDLFEIESFGLSTQVNDVKESFGNYKKDRQLLQKPNSSGSLKIYLISKERLFVVKQNAGRKKDLEDCEWLLENGELDMEVVNGIKAEF